MKYRIKEHRKSRGWSQEHLASLAGTSKGYISQLESEQREPSGEMLRSLAAAFGVDVTEMIEPGDDAAREAIEHLSIFMKLSPEDRAAVARIALGLKPDDAA